MECLYIWQNGRVIYIYSGGMLEVQVLSWRGRMPVVRQDVCKCSNGDVMMYEGFNCFMILYYGFNFSISLYM